MKKLCMNAVHVACAVLLMNGCAKQEGAGANVGDLKVVVHQANGFSTSGLSQLESARALLEQAVNSEVFKSKVLNFAYNGSQAFVQNNGLSNEAVYNLIMAGAEQLPKATASNGTMDLYTELYTPTNPFSSVIGYTDPSTNTIFMNKSFFNSASIASIADNMMHEWLHKLGFGHDSSSTARRPYSVPYAIGYITEAVVQSLQ